MRSACNLTPALRVICGLLAIRKYLDTQGEQKRNICLIPTSAHGTNPASAQMIGMEVVLVACDEDGNIDLDDLQKKAEEHTETWPL